MAFKSPLKEFAPRATYKGAKSSRMVAREPAGKKAVWAGIFFFLFIIGITTYIGYLVFKGNSGATQGQGKVSITISGPDTVKRGQEAHFLITYVNNEDVSLDDATVSLFTSGNFKPLKSTPDASSASLKVWKLGGLSSGKKGSIEITGVFAKEAGEKEFLDATLQYKPSNFSSQFSAKAHIDVSVAGPAVEVTIEGPDKVVAGQNVKYVLRYVNKGEEIKGARLKIFLPTLLEGVSLSPTHTLNDPWDMDLPQGKEGSITLTGTIKSKSSQSGALQDTLKAIMYRDSSGNISVSEAVKSIERVDPQVSVSLSGTKNSLVLKYENTGAISLKNVVVTVKIDEDQDVDTITGDFGSKDLEGGVVFWDFSTFKELSSLGPHTQGEIHFALVPITRSNTRVFHATPRVSVQMEGTSDPYVVTGNVVEIK